MIIDSYSQEEGFITPLDTYGKRKRITDRCVVSFSAELLREVIRTYHPEKIGELFSTPSGKNPVYLFRRHGKKIAFYNSLMGSACAGTNLEEANALFGGRKFVLFGSAGRLSPEVPKGSLVLPTAAYRDEGFSYHYVKPKDYIRIPKNREFAAFLRKKGIPFFSGKTWTTDAFYKETPHEIEQRRKEGCLTVEMECAGGEAVSDYRGFDFYEILFTGDCLDTPTWERGIIGTGKAIDKHLFLFDLSLEFASTL
jgi:nucleoside phosphorylase